MHHDITKNSVTDFTQVPFSYLKNCQCLKLMPNSEYLLLSTGWKLQIQNDSKNTNEDMLYLSIKSCLLLCCIKDLFFSFDIIEEIPKMF